MHFFFLKFHSVNISFAPTVCMHISVKLCLCLQMISHNYSKPERHNTPELLKQIKSYQNFGLHYPERIVGGSSKSNLEKQ